MKIYLASGNAHKAAEFRALADAGGAAGAGFEFASAAEAGGMPAVVEDAGTFAGNARKKAVALRGRVAPDSWVLADDSGLCVDALGGGPGVESAHFAGPQADSAANLGKLVVAMQDVPQGRRGATFVCVLALLGPAGVDRLFEGRCAGRLVSEPRGRAGFGYDPLFVPDGVEATLAEMPAEQKNRVGHRGRAWTECAAWLAARL